MPRTKGQGKEMSPQDANGKFTHFNEITLKILNLTSDQVT